MTPGAVVTRLVYIAGPYRAETAWGVEQNVRRAEALGFEVFKLGAMPVIPHANTRFFHGQGSDQFWLDGTLALMRRCDAVIMTNDWQLSTGATRERSDALLEALPVFHSIADLAAWLFQLGLA